MLLTKVDKVCESVSQDLSTVFKSGAVEDIVDKVSQTLGLPRSHILPMKNYEKELDTSVNINILALICLRQILRFSNDFLCNYLDEYEAQARATPKMNDNKD